MARSVAAYAIYPTMSALHEGATALKAEGFRQTDLSFLYSDRPGRPRATDAARGHADMDRAVHPAGFLEYFAGLDVLTFPEIGPLLAGGPLADAFGSARSGNRSLAGALLALGLLEDEAQRLERCLQRGHYLLSVACDDAEWARRAETILTRTGAEHLVAAVEQEPQYQP